MKDLKVVVIGRHYGANTVVRRVESYEGCVTEQVDGGGRARFPDCDLAVVCIRVISHAIYYAARDHYKALGTPVLYIESGWSEVAHEFENWLQKERGFVQRVNPQQAVRAASAAQGRVDTVLGQALQKARIEKVVKPQPVPESTPETKDERGTRSFSKKFNQEIAEAVFKALKQGQSYKEIEFTLAKAKVRKNNGRSMSASEIATYIQRHELRTYDYIGQWPAYAKSIGVDPDPMPVPVPETVELVVTARTSSDETPEPAAPPAVLPPPAPDTRTHAERMHDLIGKVLASKDLEISRKLELVEEIHAGVRTTDRQVIVERLDQTLQLTEQSIFQPGDRALVVLDKLQAIAIIEHYNQVKAFAEET